MTTKDKKPKKSTKKGSKKGASKLATKARVAAKEYHKYKKEHPNGTKKYTTFVAEQWKK